MEIWNRLPAPVRRLRTGFTSRRRTNGLKALKHEVQTCESQDVRVLWNMLNKSDVTSTTCPSREVSGRNDNIGHKKRAVRRDARSFSQWVGQRRARGVLTNSFY